LFIATGIQGFDHCNRIQGLSLSGNFAAEIKLDHCIHSFTHSLQHNYDAQVGSLVYFAADQSSSPLIHSLQQQQQQNDQAQGSLVWSFETGREIHNLFSTSFHMQQGLKQHWQLGFAVILLQLLLFFLLNPGMCFRASSLLSPSAATR
jgi:hypothetical protein